AKTDGKSLRSAFPKIRSKTDYKKPPDSDEKLWKKFFTPTLDSLLYEDEEEFQAYSKLGPLKRKLLVVGKAVPTCKETEEMPSRSHREEDTVGKSDGHITAKMIKALFKENVDEN
ncbi:CCD83 protein, partial [Motacilla alba]|nr:CCD83 protein [Motacilla alba]